MNNTKKRFNVIDFVIVVIVLGCIAGLIIRFNVIERVAGIAESEEKFISFVARDISPEIAQCIEEGDEFHSASTETLLGPVSDISIESSRDVYGDNEGKAQIFSDSTKVDISGKLKVEGFESENGFMIGGTYYAAPGKELVIQSESVQISVIITEIG